MTSNRTTAEIIKNLPQPGNMNPLSAPPYRPMDDETCSVIVPPKNKTMFAVASMKDHTSDEGWQIALALKHAGYMICGKDCPSGFVDAKLILQELEPGTLIIQDKREWDLTPRDFRDPNARLLNYLSLKNRHDVFKLTILKDAHQRPGYHAQSAEEMGVHAWISYYHPNVVCRVAPYVRREHLVRTYHSTDKNLYTWLLPEGHADRVDPKERLNKTLLSGAMSPAYPLRMYLRDHAERLPGVRTHRHPGYHRNGCATPEFVNLLQKYRVAICTSSIYGYTLRKIIEATAAGCMVITDLPTDEVLPFIDDNLIRVNSDIDWHEVYRLITRCYQTYDVGRQTELAQKCLEYYDYHPMGERLAWDIEMMRRSYPGFTSTENPLADEYRSQSETVEHVYEPKRFAIPKEPMIEAQALAKMVAPGDKRPGKWRGGVIQIWVTRACDKACFSCTQGSNLGGKPEFITPEQFEQACISLKGYFGVVGIFGGNPATHPKFIELCEIMRRYIPFEQRGLWCNNLITQEKGAAARETFNPRHSNLNVHLDKEAYTNFKKWWPESMPFGLDKDSRHSPPFVAMKDVVPDESRRWELISDCDINKHWSAMIGVFRGQLRAWFCEIAGAQAMLHQDEKDYPDTGVPLPPYEYQDYKSPGSNKMGELLAWWRLGMQHFADQVRKHCHDCGVPLRGYGQLAQSQDDHEQVSETHAGVYVPKVKDRKVEIVRELVQLGQNRISKVTDYLQNSER